MKAIIGKKFAMTQMFTSDSTVVPVTLIEAGPCVVLQVKTKETDGYEAIQVGFEPLAPKKVKKTAQGKGFRTIREFRNGGRYKVGEMIEVSLFGEGDKVAISGISKGKGFQGGVKRWGFSGRPATHGVKHEQRTIGSTGSSIPEHVIKGRHMPGRMGSERVTIKNLEIVNIDKEHRILAVEGAVPGRKGTVLEIRGQTRNF